MQVFPTASAQVPLPVPLPQMVEGAWPAWARLQGEAGWRAVDFISDLHLHRDDPATAQAWLAYLDRRDFDALFILGDLFEVWVGDDVLGEGEGEAVASAHPERTFLRESCAALRRCALQRPVYVMQGNRDFLLGTGFHIATGTQPLPDPVAFHWGSTHWLLSHGDAWCLADTDYMAFRAQVRSPQWQQAFLARPLQEREAIARDLRAQSEARKAQSRKAGLQNDPSLWADVDGPTALQWLEQTGCSTLLHGHTHRPACHVLPGGLQRLVLSDWDLMAQPPRAEVLRLRQSDTGTPQWQRLPLLADA